MAHERIRLPSGGWGTMSKLGPMTTSIYRGMGPASQLYLASGGEKDPVKARQIVEAQYAQNRARVDEMMKKMKQYRQGAGLNF